MPPRISEPKLRFAFHIRTNIKDDDWWLCKHVYDKPNFGPRFQRFIFIQDLSLFKIKIRHFVFPSEMFANRFYSVIPFNVLCKIILAAINVQTSISLSVFDTHNTPRVVSINTIMVRYRLVAADEVYTVKLYRLPELVQEERNHNGQVDHK